MYISANTVLILCFSATSLSLLSSAARWNSWSGLQQLKAGAARARGCPTGSLVDGELLRLQRRENTALQKNVAGVWTTLLVMWEPWDLSQVLSSLREDRLQNQACPCRKAVL